MEARRGEQTEDGPSQSDHNSHRLWPDTLFPRHLYHGLEFRGPGPLWVVVKLIPLSISLTFQWGSPSRGAAPVSQPLRPGLGVPAPGALGWPWFLRKTRLKAPEGLHVDLRAPCLVPEPDSSTTGRSARHAFWAPNYAHLKRGQQQDLRGAVALRCVRVYVWEVLGAPSALYDCHLLQR